MERQQAFQQLKKPCLELLQVTAAVAQNPDARKELITALTNLLSTLHSITSKPSSLDSKLAEYAFVPISQVLRLSQLVPVRALEICLECISKLLLAGWGGNLEPALSAQLLILFTFLAKPSSAGSGIAATSEELQSLALRCMTELLEEIPRSRRGKNDFTKTANIPALGEAVLVILDELVESKSNSVKLRASSALKAMVDTIGDDDALASFLPRIVSSLTKVLSPTSSNRPSFRVVEKGLNVLASLITRLLSDQATKGLSRVADPQLLDNMAKVSRSLSWLEATASQIKIALANIFRLRDHDKLEVRQALLSLCLRILQDCRISLSVCTGMAIETAISLVGREDHGSTESELKMVLSTDQQLADALRESLHGWIMSLPRVMQSKDDHGRRQIIHRISVTMRLFEHEATIIDQSLAGSLRDGVTAVLADSKGLEELAEPTLQSRSDQDVISVSSTIVQFQPLTLRLKGQDDMLAEFRLLLKELAKSDSAISVLQDLVQSMSFGSQEMHLASFWISVNLLRDLANTSASFDDFIDMGTPNLREELLDDLYSQSIAILDQQAHTSSLSWHFNALALETIALQASRYKTEFRAELSEVLYPVLHHLGSANDALRAHAMACLNMISHECGYSNAGELVVANVDYIVNAVGLKLAAGDVSPQAPQVLLMMMRLCGPSILPYLDDLVGSIFDALERYHGYSRLTELLFSVLKGMTEEGVKTPQLAITAEPTANQQRGMTKRITMVDVVDSVKRTGAETRRRKEEDEKEDKLPFPRQPWKEGSQSQAETQDDQDEERERNYETQAVEPPPPAPRPFDMLLKISELTQHYLTTESASLRTSLLSLLRTTIPVLAKHENSFLPLINTLWPVLLPRLQDEEAFIVSNALDTIALMCEHAGNFMKGRVEDSWELLKQVHRRTKQRGQGHSTNKQLGSMSRTVGTIETSMKDLSIGGRPVSEALQPAIYVDTPTRMIWSSLVGLMCTISRYVAIQDERFDEMLDMLDPVLEKSEVKEALESYNADVVWLRLYKRGQQQAHAKESKSTTPTATCAPTNTMPQGKSHWHFVQI